MTYSLGAAAPTAGRKPGSIVSQTADNMANSFDRIVEQVKQSELLRDAQYNTAKYQAAKQRAQSLTNRAAGAIGATTLSKDEVQQLLLGGLGRIQAAARKLRVVARIDSAYARRFEQRVITQVQQLSQALGRLASSVRLGGEGASGLGFIGLIILVVGAVALADYLGWLDSTDQVLREYEAICSDPALTPEQRMDCYQRVREQVNKENESDPYGWQKISEAVGTVIKVVAIGGVVLGVGYLLWTFGPALIGAGRKVRSASKRRYA